MLELKVLFVLTLYRRVSIYLNGDVIKFGIAILKNMYSCTFKRLKKSRFHNLSQLKKLTKKSKNLMLNNFYKKRYQSLYKNMTLHEKISYYY